MSKTEIDEDDPAYIFDKETQKNRIRQIIEYQKSLYWSSSSSSSLTSSAACSSSFTSSFTSSRKSSSLLELMKGGSSSLGRLFDMEHTSLSTYFEDYSGSPMLKPVFLWGSDTDDEICDMWASIKEIGTSRHVFGLEETCFQDRKTRIRVTKLARKKSFRRLPGFGFRFRLRLRRLRIMICGRKF